VVADALAEAEVRHLAARRFPTLSGGEKARVAFARARAQRTGVLLLDEPTAALDQAATDQVEAELRRYLEGGAAILMVTHSPAQAERLARRSWRMEQGRLEPLWT
jgi:ABC-type sulfate/molybdate transport systems ATPase subunit